MSVYSSPLEMLYKWEKETPDKVFLRQPINDKWHEWTWKQTGEEVRKMAAAIKNMNLPAGSNIALVSKNCAHWIISDLAIMMSGHISVPMYPNLNAETVKLILEHSEAKICFVGKLDDWKSMRPGVPAGVRCISFPFYTEPGYETWDEIIKGVKPFEEDVIRMPNELATIIYTSGTTGMPKGVMHSFHNFSFTAENAVKLINIDNSSKFFSYLPLCHIAERFLVELGGLYSGGSIAFSESLEKFPKNLAEVQPTVFLGVPRIWSKFQQGILGKMPQKKLNIFLSIPILSSLVKKKIKTGLGLSEASNIFVGAAPMPASLIRWFERLDIKIQEAYAMTENCCYSHVTLAGQIKIGCVGKSLPHVQIKLSEQNEVLTKHEGLMLGYYKEPQMTKDSFTEDGYLRTGDEGKIDKEGYLQITGRVKDIFKTTKGKYVAPAPIEMKISVNEDVDQVCVVGDGIAQPIAMITLSEAGKKKAKEEIERSLAETMNIVNPKLDQHEMLKRMVVLKGDWTVENKLLTPTLKIKRNEVEKIHRGKYEMWYSSTTEVVWEN
jgi:long-chain acyl-CoA synthetase